MLEPMLCEFKILKYHFTIYFLNSINISIFLNVSFKNWFMVFVYPKQKITILGN
jgi:hypothetical protein